jgi:hypothetical protein
MGSVGKYEKQWASKDAAVRKQGFPPSKLGPGVPAQITTSVFGGTEYKDDNGTIIPDASLKLKH